MTVQIKNEYGRIDISRDALSTVIGNATTECYGVVGMASKNLVKDGLAVVLGKENYSKGRTVTSIARELQVHVTTVQEPLPDKLQFILLSLHIPDEPHTIYEHTLCTHTQTFIYIKKEAK